MWPKGDGYKNHRDTSQPQPNEKLSASFPEAAFEDSKLEET